MSRIRQSLLSVCLLIGICCVKSPTEPEFSGREIPLYLISENWKQASPPVSLGQPAEALSKRGYVYWYNPVAMLPIRQIWPDKKIDTSKESDRIIVLNLVFKPNPNIENSVESWAGLQKLVSTDSLEQFSGGILDLWIKGDIGRLHIDAGNRYSSISINLEKDSEDTQLIVTDYPESYQNTGWVHYRINLNNPDKYFEDEGCTCAGRMIRLWIDGVDVNTLPEGQDSITISIAVFHFSKYDR